MLELIMASMLKAHEALKVEFARLEKRMLVLVQADPICRRLMSVPRVGDLVALTFSSAVDDPARFQHSKAVAAHFGLTPKKYQSGETDVTGGISRIGDESVRTALYEAANVMLTRVSRFSALKRWALDVAKRRGMKRAKVALARKLAIVLHRLWVDGTVFQWSKPAGAAA
jgi:transposase